MQCAQRSTAASALMPDGAEDVRLAVAPASFSAEVTAVVLSAAAARSLRVFLQACLWSGLPFYKGQSIAGENQAVLSSLKYL